MLAEGIIAPIIIGIFCGKSIRSLERLSFKGLPFLFLPLFLRFATYYLASRGIDFFITYGGIIQIAAFGLLLAFFILNRHQKELNFVLIGVILNIMVIAANGGVMPVSETAMEMAGITETPTGTHTYLEEGTTFPLLSDVIPIPEPYPFPKVVSIGDIVISAGVFLLIIRTMFSSSCSNENTAVGDVSNQR